MRQLLLWFLFAATCQPLHAETIDVYVWAGQSNAAGGAWPPVPPGELGYQEDVLYYPNLVTDAQYEADSPIDLQSLFTFWPEYNGASWGSEMSFAYDVSRRSQNKIAIVKVAANGAGMDTRWKSTLDGDLYDWLVTRLSVALDDITSSGNTPNLAGVVWIQGESDAIWDYWAGNYGMNLSTLISDFRTDFNAPDLPFVVPQLHQDVEGPAVSIVREQQLTVAAADENVFLINNDDQEILADGLHYTNDMHIAVGQRIADTFFNSGDFNNDGAVDAHDFSKWQNSFGVNRDGDSNADGLTDGADYLVWQRQVSEPHVSSVPEPRALLLSAAALCLLRRLRRPQVRRSDRI